MFKLHPNAASFILEKMVVPSTLSEKLEKEARSGSNNVQLQVINQLGCYGMQKCLIAVCDKANIYLLFLWNVKWKHNWLSFEDHELGSNKTE